jgi:chromatin remodeling complex protein RSC6
MSTKGILKTSKFGKPSSTKSLDKKIKWKEPIAELESELAENEENKKSQKKRRRKATMQDHVQHYDNILALLDTEIDRKSREKEKGVRSFQKARKLIVQMRKELPQVTRSKEARALCSTRKKNLNSGLYLEYTISEELADFLKVPHDTTLSRIDVMRAICLYVHRKEDEERPEVKRWFSLNPKGKRDLQDPKDRKYIIPDEKLSGLLRYKKFVQDVKKGKIYKKVRIQDAEDDEDDFELVKVEDTRLSYMYIQKLIKDHFIEAVKKVEVEVETEEDENEEVEE